VVYTFLTLVFTPLLYKGVPTTLGTKSSRILLEKEKILLGTGGLIL
jgi:hypothetical protein